MSSASAASKGDFGRVSYTVDWPTVGLAVGIYAAFLLLTYFHGYLPWWVLLPCGAFVVGLHGSLQHEAVHGYPTRSPLANLLVAGWALWLWLPYGTYRRLHLQHHIDEQLTDPLRDPESNYVTAAQWAAMSRLHRVIRLAMGSLAGRFVIGPIYFAVMNFEELARAILAGDMRILRPWLWHVFAVAIILGWVLGVCHMPFWQYVLFFAYPGTALALVRSYAEHRWAPDHEHRTAIVEAGAFWSFLFLHNNLHILHHLEPGLAWHRRPARFRELREQLVAANGGYVIHGYAELIRRNLFRRREPLLHPA
ncbi:MAG TPA: fatty acid desaturase [Dongiaceae bacterium]|jgi:fatty acid desaturase|nr:fatty acid desaturase [Dongiaceae bacterium]